MLLGTGTPFPDADRYGPAILVQAGPKNLLFDSGRGTVIRLAQAGVPVSSVREVFLTHLHSDHLVGIPDVWLTGWFLGRTLPFRMWGPDGTRKFADHLTQAFAGDVEIRQRYPESLPADAVRIEAHDIKQGTIYRDDQLLVTAFDVDHAHVVPALGYRVEYAGHSVVISGDTKLSQNLIRYAKNTDCLIHVAWMASSKNSTPAGLRSLASAEDAGRVFASVRPKLAVAYHYLDEDALEEAVRTEYTGPFVIGRDLMVIEIGEDAVRWRTRESPSRK
jgi:ribonuclease Z